MSLNTKECAWSQTKVTLLGHTFVGIRGFEYKKATAKEAIYGAGKKPIDIQEGNESFDGNLKLLKYEVDKLNDAAFAAGYGDILGVPHHLVTISVSYKRHATDPMRTAQVIGVAFTELPISMEQGATMTEVTIPWVAMDVIMK